MEESQFQEERKQLRLEQASKWRYHIVRRVFVKWGYGPRRPDSVIHVDRLRVRFNYPLMYFCFELPEATKNLPPPQEYERVKTVGWKLVSTDGFGSIGWYLADTYEQAKANMERFITKHYGEEAIPMVLKYKPTKSTIRSGVDGN
jgi:hypothetical protein